MADKQDSVKLNDGGNQVAALCVNCREGKLLEIPSPKDYVEGKHITLFGWTLILYREKVEYIDNLCGECLADRSNANEYERIAPALDDAYQRGVEEGLSR